MSVPTSEHKVYIYNDDYNKMCAEVYRHPDIETGGNLFGLWTTSGSAVIHVVLRPGQNCRRTETSFHQDIEYMKRVGNFVNKEYMLCHIGEWHSHHCLSLSKPSTGDERSVREHFPQGMSKFLVIIANIKGKNRDEIILSPYFFTKLGTSYEKAEYKVLETNNPFSTDANILTEMKRGVEVSQFNGIEGRCKTGSSDLQNDSSKVDSVSNNLNTLAPVRDQNTSDSLASGSTSESQAKPCEPRGSDQGELMDTEDSDLCPPRDYDESHSTGSECITFASQSDNRFGRQTHTAEDKNLHLAAETPSEHEIVLKKVHDQLKHWFGNQPDSMFNFEKSKTIPGAVEISFKHDHKYWMVRFPNDFPSKPAEIFHSSRQISASNQGWRDFNFVKPLENHVNILLSIKKSCSAGCSICKLITEDSLALSSALSADSAQKHSSFVNQLVSELAGAFGTTINVNVPPANTVIEIKFKHNKYLWLIRLPAQFPKLPAKVFCLFNERSNQHHVLLYRNSRHGPVDLNTSKLIIEAIYFNCFCDKCWQMRRRKKID